MALYFGTLASDQKLPARIADLVKFERAQIVIQPGAFDKQLGKCKRGEVENAIRFEFDHDDGLSTASTISGALRVFADRERLYIYLSGSSRDGRNTVQWCKNFATHRELSLGFVLTKFFSSEGIGGETNLIDVTEARILEVSLVPCGAFPRTSVSFL